MKKTGKATVLWLLIEMSFAATAADHTVETPAAEQRKSESLHFPDHPRAKERNASKGTPSIDEYDSLNTGDNRSDTVSKPATANWSNNKSQAISHDFWIFDADILLFNDDDGDGYSWGIDLLFDADTIYNEAQVYAAVYLSYEGGPWNEYAVTQDFTLFGASGNDEYGLVTELLSGYPTGDYDLLIELFDTLDGSFVASFGPEDSSELSFLPLEDFGRDAPITETRITVSHGGGGATGVWMLLVLVAGRLITRRTMWAAFRTGCPHIAQYTDVQERTNFNSPRSANPNSRQMTPTQPAQATLPAEPSA